jgi:hypothetical protein
MGRAVAVENASGVHEIALLVAEDGIASDHPDGHG